MPTQCLKPIRGKVIRATKLDACGAIVHGSKSTVVSDGFTQVQQQAQFESADEFVVKNANGDLCVNERFIAPLKWLELTITLCAVDPELVNMTTGSPLVLDDAATPQAVGFRTRESVSAEFALEVWTDLAGQTCSAGTKAYGYYLLPWVTASVLGDVTVENGAATFTITGRTHNNSPWGTGPYNVRKNASAVDSPLLVPIDPKDHRHIQLTTTPPPAAVCGASALA